MSYYFRKRSNRDVVNSVYYICKSKVFFSYHMLLSEEGFKLSSFEMLKTIIVILIKIDIWIQIQSKKEIYNICFILNAYFEMQHAHIKLKYSTYK